MLSKKAALSLLTALACAIAFAGCQPGAASPSPRQTSQREGEIAAPAESADAGGAAPTVPTPGAAGTNADGAAPTASTPGMADAESAGTIVVRANHGSIEFQLNGSEAAQALYRQLPLTIEAEDYSDNEKIFYPPQKLDPGDAPPADIQAGVLAYYAPWGDVVMFYGDYSANSSLYELGEAVSGADQGGGKCRPLVV